jgi:photosystem II stability/assembly factor-like uncharacterized protein
MSFGLRDGGLVMVGLLLVASSAFAAWHELESGTEADLHSVHFPEGTQVGYAVGVSPEGGGIVIKTTNRGDSWVLQTPGAEFALRSVYFKDNDFGYAVGEAGTALMTTDGGSTWNTMTVPGGTDNSLTYVRFPENGQVGYIGVYPRVQRGKVFKSTDGGNSWTEIVVGGPLDWSYSCGFATDLIGVVVGYDGFVVGTTSGQQDPNTTADLIAAVFSPTDPNIGYLIGNDSTQGVVRYTATGGEYPWDSVTCEPVPGAVYGVDLATTNVAYACGSDGFIARSVTATLFWQTDYDGHADLHGVCFPAGTDTGFAVGAGGVILRTYDAGGVQETPHRLTEAAEANAPTVVRGMLVFEQVNDDGRMATGTLLDISGRKVLDLAPGANDVRHLSPGVYFVRSEPSAVSGQPAAVRKVVVTR